MRLQRSALVAGMVLVTVNIWTGAPLLALWVGSRTVSGSTLSLGAVAVVCLTLGLACFALLRLLGVFTAAHDRLTGRVAARRQSPWLKSLGAERPHSRGGQAPPLAVLDYVLIGCVVACVVAFEAWFFLFAGSSIG
ncbi:MAG TPA: hypothetical protein VF533_12445 [Solirubrobacteraceae bacterium]